MQQFRDELISEYSEFKKVNGDKFNWWSYVNMKSDIQTALGFVKLFYPEVLNIEGCFILKDRYKKKIYNQWKTKESKKSDIEKMVNLYEVADFFHINMNHNDDEPELIYTFGEALKHFWSQSFIERYPDIRTKVDLFEEYGELFITVYTIDTSE